MDRDGKSDETNELWEDFHPPAINLKTKQTFLKLQGWFFFFCCNGTMPLAWQASSEISEGTVMVQFMGLAQRKKVPTPIPCVFFFYQEFCVWGKMISVLLAKHVLSHAEEWAAGLQILISLEEHAVYPIRGGCAARDEGSGGWVFTFWIPLLSSTGPSDGAGKKETR